MSEELRAWTKTEDHVRIAKLACGKGGCCYAEGIREQQLAQSAAGCCLLVRSNEQIASSVDCSAFHLFNTLAPAEDGQQVSAPGSSAINK